MKTPSIYLLTVMIFTLILVSPEPGYTQHKETKQYPVREIRDGIYVIGAFGCNIAVSEGSDGLLIVDSGRKESAETLDSVLFSSFKLPVRYVLNTHNHYDHAGGNEKFGKDGAIIAGHSNCRKRMSKEWSVPKIVGIQYPTIPPYPEAALPKICFTDSLSLHFNGETIHAYHCPCAHSDADVVYHFKNANVVHAGDFFLSNGYPIIDNFHGGSFKGIIHAIDQVLSICDEETIIIPGHGELSDKKGLLEYRTKLAETGKRIEKLFNEGKTLEEVLEANPARSIFNGDPSWLPPKLFVYGVYRDLSVKNK